MFDFSRMIAPTCDDTCLMISIMNSFSVLQVSYITWSGTHDDITRWMIDAGSKQRKITQVLFTHRLTPYAHPPIEWSLPEGAPVVGAGTARHVSHPWFSLYTCRSHACDATLEYRCRVETELPTCRETTYIPSRARGESLSPLLFTTLLSHPAARARAAGVARRSSPLRAGAPFIPLRRAVTRRDADTRGIKSPASWSTTVTRADAPGRLAGCLAGWLAGRPCARG